MQAVRVNFTGTRIQVLGDALENPRAVLSAIGAHLVKRSQTAFRDQRRSGPLWPERMNPNVMGILGDLYRGTSIPKRRLESRPALIDTGALRNSITFDFQGKRAILFGSNLHYASLQNFGGESKIWVSTQMLDNLTIVLRKERRKLVKHEKAHGKGSYTSGLRGLGWLYSYRGEYFTIRVRARQFIGYDAIDEREIKKIVRTKFGDAQ